MVSPLLPIATQIPEIFSKSLPHRGQPPRHQLGSSASYASRADRRRRISSPFSVSGLPGPGWFLPGGHCLVARAVLRGRFRGDLSVQPHKFALDAILRCREYLVPLVASDGNRVLAPRVEWIFQDDSSEFRMASTTITRPRPEHNPTYWPVFVSSHGGTSPQTIGGGQGRIRGLGGCPLVARPGRYPCKGVGLVPAAFDQVGDGLLNVVAEQADEVERRTARISRFSVLSLGSAWASGSSRVGFSISPDSGS